MKHFLQWGSLLIAALLLLVPPASAQVTEITSQDLIDLVGVNQASQVFETTELDPTQTPRLQAVLDATGTNKVYDLRGFDFRLTGQGIIRYRTIAEAQSLGWPGSSDAYFSQADYAFAFLLEDTGGGGGTVYSYHDLLTSGSDAGDNSYGSVTLFSGMQSTFTYDPPLLQYKTPLVFEPTPTTWSDQASSSSGTVSISGEVEGYGTLRTPAGDYEVIRVRRDNGGAFPTTDYEFLSPDVGFTVATVEGQGDGTYVVTFTAASDVFEEQPVSAGQTGSIVSSGRASVSFTTGSSAGGTLALATYNQRPYNRTFSTQTASSDDGTSIQPNVLWDDQYYSVLNIDDNLSDFAATVCVDYSSVAGVQAARKLVLLTRSFANEAWRALNTSINGTSICATVTSFSQFAVGSDDRYNTLPVELTAFAAERETGGIRVTWKTLLETDNAGFHVERAVDNGAFASVHFEAGAGTTTEATRYRFVDAGVPFSAEAVQYRLRQVDLDGTATLSDPVRVEIGLPQRLVLHAPFPNPARTSATLRYELPEATDVQMQVYNVLGQQVATLDAGRQNAGPVESIIDTSRWPSGLYVIRLRANGAVHTQRLLVVR